MLYKQAANIAQRVWSSLRKTVPGLPKKYTGQFNSVLPLNPGTGKGTSRLYNKGVGDYRFKWPNLGDRTLIEAKGGQYIGGLNPENAHWWFKPKGEKVYSPLARYDESLLSKNLKNNYRIKTVEGTPIDRIKPYHGQNGIIGLFLEQDIFNIPNAAVGDPQFMQKLKQARILRKAKGKPKPRDLNYGSKPRVSIHAENSTDLGGSYASLIDNRITWAPTLSARALDNNLNFRSKDPLATNGGGLSPISLSSAKSEPLDINHLLHEANHLISFNKPKNRGSFALARRRFIRRADKKADRLGIDPYVLDYIEAAQYGLHAKEGLAALKNEPLGLIPTYRLPATRIAAAGVNLFKSSPQEILKTIDKMYDVPLDSLMSVSPEFTRSVLATANTRLRATDATRRLNLQRQLAQVKHNNVSKALNLLEQWKAKGSVDATTYSTLHDNLRRMSKQLTQGTDTLKAQAKELQSVNRRYRKMFKDASYTRAVWDKIPSHFIEKV